MATVSQSSRKRPKKVYVPWLPRPVGAGISGSDSERRFLHHVRESTIKDLAFSPNRINFWNDLVLAPAHSNEAIRHALVALGAAHWLFLARPSTPTSSHPAVETSNLENLILQQYNQAIQHLTSKMCETQSTDSDFHFTLICCLVFFCLENMMGRYAESLQHLRAGSKLLASSHSTPGSRESTPKSSPRSSEANDAICEIADMFTALGVDASIFMNGPVVPDLSSYCRPLPEIEQSSDSFSNLEEARNLLCAIEVDFRLCLDSSRDDWESDEMQALHERLRHWATRFDKSQLSVACSGGNEALKHEFMALNLSRRVWLIAIDSTEATDEERAFAEVLDLAENLIQASSSTSHPVFTLQADIVPALSFVCDTSDDSAVQRRAISLLRSMQRREGLWDSSEVAEYLEDSLTARKLLQQEWDNVIGGLPGGVRKLSALNMSTLSPHNGILLMANQTQNWPAD